MPPFGYLHEETAGTVFGPHSTRPASRIVVDSPGRSRECLGVTSTDAAVCVAVPLIARLTFCVPV